MKLRNYSFLLILFSLLVSCTNKSESRKELNKSKYDTLQNKSVEKDVKKREVILSSEVEAIPIINQPVQQFIAFCKKIQKDDWLPDPERLIQVNIYPSLNNQNKKQFEGLPFYQIQLAETEITKSQALHILTLDEQEILTFKNVKSIWGYFYRGKKVNNTISDGVIEQWEFSNKENAIHALEILQLNGMEIYINTNPYFCRINNKIFIFHTRAMSFSFDQNQVFRSFEDNYCD
jgi:hypothetical protein